MKASKISPDEQVKQLEQWFGVEISKLKKNMTQLMKEYDRKKSLLLQAKVRNKIKK